MQARSRTLTYLAVVSVLASIVWLAAGMALMLGGSVGATFGVPTGGETLALGAALFALGVVGLGVGYGFWSSRAWAWTAGIAIFGISIVLNVLAIIVGANVLSTVLPVVVAGIVLWFLIQPKVKSELRPNSI